LETTDTPFQVFSLRNLISFLLGFSWTGISFYNSIANASLLILLSTTIGVLFVLFFFLIIKQIQRFAEDNSFKYSKTINKTGEVYLTIPENRSGYGKVLISVNGSVHELEAMTENDKIESGKLIKVVKIESDKILIVEKI
jgi:membrane-bound ClpP family serine protease